MALRLIRECEVLKCRDRKSATRCERSGRRYEHRQSSYSFKLQCNPRCMRCSVQIKREEITVTQTVTKCKPKVMFADTVPNYKPSYLSVILTYSNSRLLWFEDKI